MESSVATDHDDDAPTEHVEDGLLGGDAVASPTMAEDHHHPQDEPHTTEALTPSQQHSSSSSSPSPSIS